MLGDADRLAQAALGHGRPGGFMANANLVDEALIALCEEANTALAGAQTIVRARLLAQLAAELVSTPHRDRRLALVREAVDVARRTGDRQGLAAVLHTGLIAINDALTATDRSITGAAPWQRADAGGRKPSVIWNPRWR